MSTRLHVSIYPVAVFVGMLMMSLSLQTGQRQQAETPPRRPLYDPAAFYAAARINSQVDQGTSQTQQNPDYVQGLEGNKVVYQSYRNNNWDLYLARWDTGGDTRLTVSNQPDVQPRINRQADRVVYASRVGEHYQIFSMNLDGSDISQLTQANGDCLNPSWSPDGSRIVFQRYRNGQYDIFMMNANGANAQALTIDPAYDGEAYWSPDGSQIAFVSNRSGGYRVWVMNMDGSNPTQRSLQPLASYPAWSPDGTMISYSADEDGDGFLELWLMDANGSNQHLIYNPNDVQNDAIAWGWNPGSNMVTFTTVSWIQYQGNWYWDLAIVSWWDLVEISTGQISYNSPNTNWNPDWQSLDHQPPTSHLSVPAIVPANFMVFVNADDADETGVFGYYIQYKHDLAEVWVDYLYYGMTQRWPPDPYFWMHGQAGEKFYIRVRSRDNAGNLEPWPPDYSVMTVIESLPPVSGVEPLSPFIHSPFQVSWNGYDPGGSEIDTYDIQYRDAADGSWVDWLMGTSTREVEFSGTLDHTYCFRSRAVDRATNQEDWPIGDGDTCTRVYAWEISGKIQDNSGAPVGGAEVSATPPAVAASYSDRDGQYTAYVTTPAENYACGWSKAEYGVLPSSSFSPDVDATLEVILPPTDNLIQQSDFEEGAFTSAWVTGGELQPTIVNTQQHTGQYAAQLTNQAESAYTDYLVADNIWDYSQPALARASDDLIHLVWLDHDQSVWYADQQPDGTYNAPFHVSTEVGSANPKLTVDSTGGVHVLWEQGWPSQFYYAYRSPAGIWSAPINLTGSLGDGRSEAPLMVTDESGILHLLWRYQYRVNYSDKMALMYARRDTDGNWSTPQNLPEAGDVNWLMSFTARLDTTGNLYAAWANRDYYSYLHYAQRSTAGNWSQAVEIASGLVEFLPDDLYLGLRSNGHPFLVWNNAETYNYQDYGMYYASQNNDSSWTSPIRTLFVRPTLVQYATQDPQLIYVLLQDDAGLKLYHLQEDGAMQPLDDLPAYASPVLLFDSMGQLYIAWTATRMAHVARYNAESSWSETDVLPYDYMGGLVLTGDGVPHMFWNVTAGLFHTTRTLATQTGTSSIEQEMHIPITMTTPVLSFLYNLSGFPNASGSQFQAEVMANSNTTSLLSSEQVTQGWIHAHFNLSAWAGQTITVRFSASQGSGQQPLWAYVDDATLGSGHPDVWVVIDGAYSAMPGEQVAFEIRYGNHGHAPAKGLQISTTLPPGLTFISASMPPDINGSSLSWDVDNLEGQDESGIISLMVDLSNDLPIWSTLYQPIVINPASNEIETMNNTYEKELLIGEVLHLPIISH